MNNTAQDTSLLDTAGDFVGSIYSWVKENGVSFVQEALTSSSNLVESGFEKVGLKEEFDVVANVANVVGQYTPLANAFNGASRLIETFTPSLTEVFTPAANDPSYNVLESSNSFNFEVMAMQNKLKALGYDLEQGNDFENNGVDGYYGAVTTSAVEQFQKDNGLEVTGIANAETLVKMEEAFLATDPDINTNPATFHTGLTEFEKIANFVIDKLEGGNTIVQEPNGGIAKYGINSKAHPDVDIENLTREDALAIYKEEYWDKPGIGSLPPHMRLPVFDTAVNHGVGDAGKFYAMSGDNPHKLRDIRAVDYKDLAESNPEKFAGSLDGWNNRLDKVAAHTDTVQAPQEEQLAANRFAPAAIAP